MVHVSIPLVLLIIPRSIYSFHCPIYSFPLVHFFIQLVLLSITLVLFFIQTVLCFIPLVYLSWMGIIYQNRYTWFVTFCKILNSSFIPSWNRNSCKYVPTVLNGVMFNDVFFNQPLIILLPALILEEIAIDSHNKEIEDHLLQETHDLHLASPRRRSGRTTYRQRSTTATWAGSTS